MDINQELEETIENKFLTPTKFALKIEEIVETEKVNYIDAIVMFCEMHNLEVDSISKLIPKPLKEKLKCNAIELNFIKKTTKGRLPI